TADDKHAFNLAAAECGKRYSKRERVRDDGAVISIDIHSLDIVEPRREGYEIIKQKRAELEPLLGELERSGEMTDLGCVGKLERQVLKMATVMHVFNCLGKGREVGRFIPDELIRGCIGLFIEYGKHTRGIIQNSGEAGSTAELET